MAATDTPQVQAYGDYPLRLIGSDVPNQVSDTPLASKDVSSSPVGVPNNLSKLNNLSYSAIAESAKALTQGVQVAGQATQDMTKAAEFNVNAWLPAADARARNNAYTANQTPQYLESISRTISGMVQSQNNAKILTAQQQEKLQQTIQAQMEKQAQALHDQTADSQYTKALVEMSNHVENADTTINDATGVDAYRQRAMAIIAKYPELDESAKRKLLTDAYMAERKAIDSTSSAQQKAVTEANQTRAAAAKADFSLAMTGQISALHTGFLSSDQFQKNLNDNIKAYSAAHPELSTRDLQEIVASQLQEGAKASLNNENNKNTMLKNEQQSRGFLNEISPSYESYQAGKMSLQDFQLREALLADKYGVPRNLVPALEHPDVALNEVIRKQELQNKLNVLAQNNAISDEQKQAVDPLHVGYLVSLLKGTAGLDESVRSNKVLSSNPDWVRALAVYQQQGQAETKLATLKNQNDTLNKALNAELSGGIKDSVNLTLPGGIQLKDIPAELQLLAQKQQLTPAQQEQLNAIRRNNVDTIRAEMQRNQTEMDKVRQPLKIYGWDNGVEGWNSVFPQYKDHIDYINKAHSMVQAGSTSALPATQKAPNPNFNYAAAPQKSALLPSTINGQAVLLPFSASMAKNFQGLTDGFGAPGNGNNQHHDHFHRGIDLAAPEGTPVVSHGYGVVKHSYDPSRSGGYGNMVDILYQDGKVVRYGHLHGRSVNENDEIFPGEWIGTVGSTGHSTGNHLHFEVRNNADFTDEDTIDPIAYLKGISSTSNTTAPRSNNLDKVDKFNPYQASNQKQITPDVLPQGAIQIPGGYILGNKIIPYKMKSDSVPVATRSMFNANKPMHGSAAPTTKEAYAPNEPEANYGYAPIARDKAFARKIHDVSNRLGIPAVWLADVMAFETGSTFNPADDNHKGYGGLIGFGDDDAKEFGLGNRYDMFKMDRLKQMDYVYKYLARFPGQLTDVQSVLAAVFGGAGLLHKWKTNPQRALNTGDGDIKFGRYLQRLGEDAGRRYKL